MCRKNLKNVYSCPFALQLDKHFSMNQAIHDVQFSCAITSRFTEPLIPCGASVPGGKMRKQLLKDHNFLKNSPIFIIESSTLIYLLFKKHCIQYISIWKIILDLVKGTWHHNFMAGCGSLLWANTYSLWSGIKYQGQGVYSGRSDVVGSSQVRLCHTCIIDVMPAHMNIFSYDRRRWSSMCFM